MSDDVKPMSGGVKFSQFKKVTPAADKKIEMVGLRDGDNIRADLTTDLVSTKAVWCSVIPRDALSLLVMYLS